MVSKFKSFIEQFCFTEQDCAYISELSDPLPINESSAKFLNCIKPKEIEATAKSKINELSWVLDLALEDQDETSTEFEKMEVKVDCDQMRMLFVHFEMQSRDKSIALKMSLIYSTNQFGNYNELNVEIGRFVNGLMSGFGHT